MKGITKYPALKVSTTGRRKLDGRKAEGKQKGSRRKLTSFSKIFKVSVVI